MTNQAHILKDLHGRAHSYLRISLVERCNLRCFYCMPAEGIQLTPKKEIMTYEEIFKIAKTFVAHGVTKIRLTGGEPLIRKDFPLVLEKLAKLPVELSITTNGVIIHKYIHILKLYGLNKINVSLDSLQKERFHKITLRDHFDRVYENILLLIKEGFKVKLNAVLMRGVNDDEVADFINLTKELPVSVRFIEYMPFDGNKWNIDQMVSLQEIMDTVNTTFKEEEVERLQDAPNDTARNFRIKGYKGSFAIISSVTNPFCDSCNRLRLTANGYLKNCLFSTTESNLLGTLREGGSIEPVIQKAVQGKLRIRGGMDTLQKLKEPQLHRQNRSMTTIGG